MVMTLHHCQRYCMVLNLSLGNIAGFSTSWEGKVNRGREFEKKSGVCG